MITCKTGHILGIMGRQSSGSRQGWLNSVFSVAMYKSPFGKGWHHADIWIIYCTSFLGNHACFKFALFLFLQLPSVGIVGWCWFCLRRPPALQFSPFVGYLLADQMLWRCTICSSFLGYWCACLLSLVVHAIYLLFCFILVSCRTYGLISLTVTRQKRLVPP